MRKTTRLALAMLVAAIGFGLSPALHAQEAPGSAASPRPGMSDHDRMMSNEMPGMMKMIDDCSRMMQSMNDRRGSPSPDRPQETPPPK